MTSLRWRMTALLMIGSIINYLTRRTLGVAAPPILQDLHITTQQYSWIVSTFQGALMLQPICGYVLDTRIHPSSVSATTISSPPPRSSGFRACRSTTHVIW